MKQILLLTCVVFLLFSASCNQANLTVGDLSCENLGNPLGIDNTNPRLSWKVRSNRNGTEQKAYQILVSGSRSLLEQDRGDLWDSGKTGSSSSVLVPYHGKSLSSGEIAYWKVRVWDETGKVSSWSPVARFSIGLLKSEDWQASYIGFPTGAGYKECPQLKRSFQVDKKEGTMLLYVNSLGYHEVYLNGKKVGDGVLAPAVSEYTKRSLSNTYDVSSLIKKGTNTLMIWLGSGWYTEGLPGVVNNGPLVKAQLEVTDGSNRDVLLVTDGDWQGRKSGYSRVGDWRPHHFGGEVVDGLLAQSDLAEGNSGRGDWAPVSVAAVSDRAVSPQMVELNRIFETMKPEKIVQVAKDTFLVDMGKCLTGWAEIHFSKLVRSQQVILEYSDHLDHNRNFEPLDQTDQYIAAGQGPEVFKNKFNYHGFRYIRISNLQEAPAPDSVSCYLIHTGYELASGFQCSDNDLNRIHDMIFYTLRCLSLGGDLVDCPSIERMGYGGDGNASTETAETMFNLDPLYANWLQAWADCIREDGGMPHTAPNPYTAGGGPYWCGFIIPASWKTYQHYGDTLVLKKYYPAMQSWLGYVDKYSVDGLLMPWPDTDYRGWYLGDWAVPRGVDQKAEASVNLVNNCFLVICYDDMSKIAGLLGKPGDADLYARKRDQLRSKIHQVFFNPASNSYGTASQIDLTYPLLAGVVPDSLKEAVVKSLYHEINDIRGGHIATGLVGIPVFTEWAVKNKAVDLMYSMLKKKDCPGYLYMIENGATTTWENWAGERSYIHNCYNGIGSWFYQAIGGIVPDENSPAYSNVLICPQVPKGVTWAKTFKETPYGRLAVNWELNNREMSISVEIPVGMEAGIVIPPGVEKYTLNGNGYSQTGKDNNVVNVKSGKYQFRYILREI